MSHIIDERGYNQIFRATKAQELRLRRRADRMIEAMELPASASARARCRILELGCGTGELAHQLAERTGAQVVGIDLSEGFVARAQVEHRHPGLRFVVADLNGDVSALGSEPFDYIVGNGLLHHLYYQLDSVLPRLRAWLRPGGRLIFWEPNLLNPYIHLIFSYGPLRRWAKLEPAEMAFTPRFIGGKLEDAGFSAVRVQTRDFLLPNIPVSMIAVVSSLGSIAERVPGVRAWAQSLFIVAESA